MFHANAHSEQLQGEYEQLSSRVLKAEAAIVRARAELERVRQVLARYCGRQTEIKNILRGLEFAREAAVDNLHQLFASWDAHRVERSTPPLPEADMEAVAREEAQKRVDAKVEGINLQIKKLLHGVSTL